MEGTLEHGGRDLPFTGFQVLRAAAAALSRPRFTSSLTSCPASCLVCRLIPPASQPFPTALKRKWRQHRRELLFKSSRKPLSTSHISPPVLRLYIRPFYVLYVNWEYLMSSIILISISGVSWERRWQIPSNDTVLHSARRYFHVQHMHVCCEHRDAQRLSDEALHHKLLCVSVRLLPMLFLGSSFCIVFPV